MMAGIILLISATSVIDSHDAAQHFNAVFYNVLIPFCIII